MGQFLVFIRFSPNLTRIIYEQVQARIWVISLSHPESVTQTIYKQLRTCVGVPFIAITISFKNTHASTLPAIFHLVLVDACFQNGRILSDNACMILKMEHSMLRYQFNMLTKIQTEIMMRSIFWSKFTKIDEICQLSAQK